MKTVALVELEYHNEVLRSFLLQLLSQEIDVIVFTTEFNYNQIQDLQKEQKIHWVLKGNNESRYNFLINALITNVNSWIFIGFDTITKQFDELNIPHNAHYVIHDLNTSVRPKEYIQLSLNPLKYLKERIKYLQFILRKEAEHQRSFLSKFTSLLVPSQSVLDYAKNNIKSNFRFQCSMFTLNEFEVKEMISETIRIVIPGSIDFNRRNYDEVYLSFEKIGGLFKRKVELVFLGSTKSSTPNRFLNKFENIPNLQIKTFDKFINQSEFDNEMSKAHFLILPIQRMFKYKIFIEERSKTCVSGNINDMVRFAKPSLIPSYYELDKNLESSCKRYQSVEELQKLILLWVNDLEYTKLYKNIDQSIKEFQADKLGKHLIETIL